jgi:hypothetical protein
MEVHIGITKKRFTYACMKAIKKFPEGRFTLELSEQFT